MKRIKQFLRLLHIQTILAKNGLDQIILGLHLFAPLRFMIYLNPWNWFRSHQFSSSIALRKTLEELGPIFVKFGQALSTRPDVLPAEFAQELAKLQDNVAPFSSQHALDILETTFGRSAFDIFQQFDPTPLASASMAQVHAATLKSGEHVVVKILRPRIRKIIQQDLSILRSLANLADRYWAESKRFKPKEIVAEFEKTLMDELDLQREAANASLLKRNFQQSSLLYVPTIYWDYVRTNVLVMERIYGLPVTDTEALHAHQINIKALAENGVTLFFTQVFRDCLFHADMHPGNIFVSPHHRENPQYICVDFGIMGSLNNNDKRYLAENLLAFFQRDYHRVAQLHIESGWVARNTRVDEFESAIRTVCEPIFERPLKDISFALVVLRLFQVARRFHMEVQPQLVLLQKTLLAIEGLGRQLDPDLNLWMTAKPFLEKWIREELSPKAFINHMRQNLPFLIEQLPHVPRLMSDVLTLTKEHYLKPQQPSNNKQEQPRRTSWWHGLGVGALTSTLLFINTTHWHLLNQHENLLMTISLVISAILIIFISRTRNE
jgi:ubiquinone biosynthesis protein